VNAGDAAEDDGTNATKEDEGSTELAGKLKEV